MATFDPQDFFVPNRIIGIPISSENDKVIRYGGYVNSTAGIPVNELVARGDFWFHNEGGILYLCHQVQHPFAAETSVNGVFNNGSGNYYQQAVDFFGGHPKERPRY